MKYKKCVMYKLRNNAYFDNIIPIFLIFNDLIYLKCIFFIKYINFILLLGVTQNPKHG